MSTDRITPSLETEESAGENSTSSALQKLLLETVTILLVEDEQMVRTLARHILEVIGYKVLEAESGCEALEICKDHEGVVHLLLTDVVMPKMSGPQLSKEVVKIWPDIGILFMSGYTDNIIAQHDGFQDGMAFLQKPFSPETLALKVREILDATEREINAATNA